jgi:putative sterol carrier protein
VAAVAARAFFEGLEARAATANLQGIDHSYRFEIEGEGSWQLRIHAGTVTVTEGGADAATDATIRTSSEVFERIVSGKQNPATAYMTGKIKVDGDLGAVLKLQKVF